MITNYLNSNITRNPNYLNLASQCTNLINYENYQLFNKIKSNAINCNNGYDYN